MFYYFSEMAPTGYSVTVSMDVTKLVKPVKGRKIKFFPVYLWLVTKNLNKQTEFKIAVQDGKVGCFDVLTPLYASFHDDDKTFCLMWTKYDDFFGILFRIYRKQR